MEQTEEQKEAQRKATAGETEEEAAAHRREDIEKLLSPEFKGRLDQMNHKDVVPLLYQAAQDLLGEVRELERQRRQRRKQQQQPTE